MSTSMLPLNTRIDVSTPRGAAFFCSILSGQMRLLFMKLHSTMAKDYFGLTLILFLLNLILHDFYRVERGMTGEDLALEREIERPEWRDRAQRIESLCSAVVGSFLGAVAVLWMATTGTTELSNYDVLLVAVDWALVGVHHRFLYDQ